ncbi:hypothetical protein Golob_025969, partial [Gossypium lobatum]|nr:hypothetical protein [Gossypium lobatum]
MIANLRMWDMLVGGLLGNEGTFLKQILGNDLIE